MDAASFYSSDQQKADELRRVLYAVSAVIYHHIVNDACAGAELQQLIAEFCESTHTGLKPRSPSVHSNDSGSGSGDAMSDSLSLCSNEEEATASGDIVPTHHSVYHFLLKMYQRGDFMPCAAVVSLIFIHRLCRAHRMPLTADNWKCVCVISLMVAQKLFDDVPLANGEFSILYPAISKRTVNLLEVQFLRLLGYRVDVTQRLYWQYHGELLAIVPHDFEQRMAASFSRQRPPLSPSLSELCCVARPQQPADRKSKSQPSLSASASSSSSTSSSASLSVPRLALSPKMLDFSSFPASSSSSSSLSLSLYGAKSARAVLSGADSARLDRAAACMCDQHCEHGAAANANGAADADADADVDSDLSALSRAAGSRHPVPGRRRHSCDAATLASAAALLAAASAALDLQCSGPTCARRNSVCGAPGDGSHRNASAATTRRSSVTSLWSPAASSTHGSSLPHAHHHRCHHRRCATARQHTVSRRNSCESTPGSVLSCHVDSMLVRCGHSADQCKLTTNVY